MTTTTTLTSILQSHTCHHVISKQKLVSCENGEDVLTCALRMTNAKVSSIPVFGAAGASAASSSGTGGDSAHTTRRCLGLVDFQDIVGVVLDKIAADRAILQDKDQLWKALSSISIEKAIDASGRDPASEISADAPLQYAAQLFLQLGIKRLLVVHPESKNVIGVLSPSALCSYAIAQLKGIVDPLLSRTVEEFGLGQGPVIYVSKRVSFLDALAKMRHERKTIIAVCDERTKSISGSVSMSDIKLIFSQRDVTLFSMSCWDFIVMSRSLLDSEQFPFFGVNADSKVLSVVSKLLATHVHHVYVVDAKSVPKAVISFNDVLRAFCA